MAGILGSVHGDALESTCGDAPGAPEFPHEPRDNRRCTWVVIVEGDCARLVSSTLMKCLGAPRVSIRVRATWLVAICCRGLWLEAGHGFIVA